MSKHKAKLAKKKLAIRQANWDKADLSRKKKQLDQVHLISKSKG